MSSSQLGLGNSHETGAVTWNDAVFILIASTTRAEVAMIETLVRRGNYGRHWVPETHVCSRPGVPLVGIVVSDDPGARPWRLTRRTAVDGEAKVKASTRDY